MHKTSKLSTAYWLAAAIFLSLAAASAPNAAAAQTCADGWEKGGYGPEFGCAANQRAYVCSKTGAFKCESDPGAVCSFSLLLNPDTSPVKCNISAGHSGHQYGLAVTKETPACKDYIKQNGGILTLWYQGYTNQCINSAKDLNGDHLADNYAAASADDQRQSNDQGSGAGEPAKKTAGEEQPNQINTFIPNPVIWNTLQDLINAIADFIAFIALPLAIIMLIWSGLKFLFSQGNQEKVLTAKRTFLWTVVGVVAIIGVYVILATIRRFFAVKSLF